MTTTVKLQTLIGKGTRGDWFINLYTRTPSGEYGKLVHEDIPVTYDSFFRDRNGKTTWPNIHQTGSAAPTAKDLAFVQQAQEKGLVAVVKKVPGTPDAAPQMGEKLYVHKVKHVSMTATTFDLELGERVYNLV